MSRPNVNPRPLSYAGFGLEIASEFPLPELEQGSGGAPDLTIRMAPEREPALPEGIQVRFRHEQDQHTLTWLAVGTFRILGTDVIEVEPAPGVKPSLIALPLLGPVFALLLHLRGTLVLHASAVDIGDGAVVFLGDKTAGKSTTAAAFVRAGGRLLTDDVLAIDMKGPQPLIRPGFPQLKLDRGAASGLVSRHGAELPDIAPWFPKAQHRLSGEFSLAPVRPLRCYVLDRRDGDPSATPLPGMDGLTALIRFSYVVRFGQDVLGHEARARHFRHCAALASAAGVSRLQVPQGIERLDEVVALVREDCR
jgi:hypothetical protein